MTDAHGPDNGAPPVGSSNPKVDWFFAKATPWQAEYRKLRTILLSCPVEEDLKWGVPAYVVGGKNVALVHGFKGYCAVLFPKGALLTDPSGLLTQQTPNVQAARQLRFTSLTEIAKRTKALQRFVKQAIALEKAGAKVKLKRIEEYEVPPEFQERLDDDSRLNEAFERLTPGRRRAYLFHFGQAKRPETRLARISKYVPAILAGRGLDD